MINELSGDEAERALRHCCGANAWCKAMTRLRPFADHSAMHAAADNAFDKMSDQDWIEAFTCHPKIGDVDSLRMKFAGNKQWSAGEQAGISDGDQQTIEDLARGNRDYEARFGYIFIVCATGKSAAEMLTLLKDRIGNDPRDELAVAAAEQRKITHLRIDKLLNPQL